MAYPVFMTESKADRQIKRIAYYYGKYFINAWVPTGMNRGKQCPLLLQRATGMPVASN